MPITIGSNIASLRAQRQLGRATAELSSTYERLSSGQRINKASDDAAGLAISSQLNAKGKILGQSLRNINDGVSVVNIAEGAVDTLKTVLLRIKELSVQSANGSLSSKQRNSLDQEAQALSKEYTRVIRSTAFNGLTLFGSQTEVSIQAAEGVSGVLGVNFVSQTGVQGGSGAFSSITNTAAGDGSGVNNEQLLGDLNGDGYDDIVRLTAGDSRVTVFLNRGDGSFAQGVSYSSYFQTEAGKLGDINNDGVLDLVSIFRDGADLHGISVRLGNGDGTFKPQVTSVPGELGFGSSIQLADFNSDGKLDFVTSSQAFFRSPLVSFGNGDGSFATGVTYSNGAIDNSGVIVGDFNGDGAIDFIAAPQGGGANRMNIYLNNGSGGFTNSFFSTGAGTNEAQLSNAGDLNSDGYLDLAYRNRNTGETLIALGRGDGTFNNPYSIDFPTTPDAKATIADIDGDGDLDIVTTVANAGIQYKLGNGDGTFSQTISNNNNAPANSSGVVSLSDLNRDGALDVVRGGFGAFDGFTVYLQTPGQVQSTARVKVLAEISLKNRSDAYKTLKLVSDEFDRLSAVSSALGASLSRLSTSKAVAGISKENYAAANSRILDADIAQDAANLVRQQILQKASTAILAQANISPQLALMLVK